MHVYVVKQGMEFDAILGRNVVTTYAKSGSTVLNMYSKWRFNMELAHILCVGLRHQDVCLKKQLFSLPQIPFSHVAYILHITTHNADTNVETSHPHFLIGIDENIYAYQKVRVTCFHIGISIMCMLLECLC